MNKKLYSAKHKDYITEINGNSQIVYLFPNGYGLSAVHGMTLSLPFTKSVDIMEIVLLAHKGKDDWWIVTKPEFILAKFLEKILDTVGTLTDDTRLPISNDIKERHYLRRTDHEN